MTPFVRLLSAFALLALCGCPSTQSGGGGAAGDPLRDPSVAAQKAPESYVIRMETTKGTVRIKVTRAWAPLGADRVYSLVKAGFYDGCRFFRVLNAPRPFMAQFGINGDPDVSAAWLEARIKDDPVKESNTRGRMTFAMSGKNTRTTQLFINYADNSNLDRMGFAPCGEVIEGMEFLDRLYGGYGEGAPRGKGPDQFKLQSQGNAYLDQAFPALDGIKTATIE